jgi:hypothetical protein
VFLAVRSCRSCIRSRSGVSRWQGPAAVDCAGSARDRQGWLRRGRAVRTHSARRRTSSVRRARGAEAHDPVVGHRVREPVRERRSRRRHSGSSVSLHHGRPS